MNENINLCEILKGHEGETIYCSLIGKNVTINTVTNNAITICNVSELITLHHNGGYRKEGECQLYPSKDQRDWIRWDEEHNNKTPKTWSELISIHPDKTVTSGKCAYTKLTFNEFKQQYLMEKKAIEMTLEQAQKLYKNGNKDMKNLLLTTFSKEELEDTYPKTWEECLYKFDSLYYISGLTGDIASCDLPPYSTKYLKNCLPSEKIAKQVRALEQLLVCRDVWRNGWVPTTYNYYIYKNIKGLPQVSNSTVSHVLSFETHEIAQNFLNTFKDLIEEAGDLI